MKIKVLISCALVALLSFSSCKKRNFDDSTVITYGTSFGFCVGYCAKELSLSQTKAVYTKKKNGSSPDTKTCAKQTTEAEFAEIRQLLNGSAIENLPETIGCPDCADGGAEWVGVTTNGKTYKVTFEYGKAPITLKALVTKLKALSDSFNGCD